MSCLSVSGLTSGRSAGNTKALSQLSARAAMPSLSEQNMSVLANFRLRTITAPVEARQRSIMSER